MSRCDINSKVPLSASTRLRKPAIPRPVLLREFLLMVIDNPWTAIAYSDDDRLLISQTLKGSRASTNASLDGRRADDVWNRHNLP